MKRIFYFFSIIFFGILLFSRISLAEESDASAADAAAAQDSITLPDISLSSIVPESAQGPIIQAFAGLTAFRPFQGVLPINHSNLIGLDFSLDIMLMKLPANFGSAFGSISGGGDSSSSENSSENNSGSSSGSSSNSLPALPMLRPTFHKGVGNKLDVGVSGFYYLGSYILGGDIKYLVYAPEEGLFWAFRINYNKTRLQFAKLGVPVLPIKIKETRIGYASLALNTQAISPQIILGKKLHFAEPYFGFGLDVLSGNIELPIVIEIANVTKTLSTDVTRTYSGTAFMGVNFRTSAVGLILGFQGSYNTAGMHTLGINLGVGL